MTVKRSESTKFAVMAERVFQRADGREVRAQLGQPRRDKGKANTDWVCSFRVLGVGHSKVYSLAGTDSLEALKYAQWMMAVRLEDYQRKFGLTYLNEADLHLVKFEGDPDATIRQIKSRADFQLWGHVLDGV
jgi:hypothetical protein